MDHKKQIDELNSFLRGELAATETYQQAIDKVGAGSGSAALQTIHADHRERANEFRQHVRQFGGQPDQGSGAWGGFAKAITGTAKIFGETAALKALKEGEEKGISSYENALQNENMPLECQTLLRDSLTQCRTHVQMLDRLMSN